MIPKGCNLTECGRTRDGLRVRAITDMLGAQVVVTNDLKPEEDTLLSQPLESHEVAVNLGKNVVKHGTSIYGRWTGPLGS